MVDVSHLRRWLSLLRRPERLDSPEVVALLQTHGRLPVGGSPLAVGQAAADLLVEAIGRLQSSDGEGRERNLAQLVLRTCFVDGLKLFQAAHRLGMSERQLSRERAWAIGLLKAELESTEVAPPDEEQSYLPEPIPTISGYRPRLALTQALLGALGTGRVVLVTGPAGIGKTSFVADLAAQASQTGPVLWYRVRAGVNDSLTALLYEIGEYQRARGHDELARHFERAMPDPDPALAARIAVRCLAEEPPLLVVDDFHLVEQDPAICGFLDEAVGRIPELHVVAITRHRESTPLRGEWFAVPPFTRVEVRKLLEQLGVRCAAETVDTLHQWTNGVPQLVNLSAAWLRTSADEAAVDVPSLASRDQVQDFLLSTITDLLDPDDRAILEAASVFRDRFSDDALATVAQRTRGAVLDASQRFVRTHVATRSRAGDCAFFHASVRDYVYERLGADERRALHRRAADWYAADGNADEAAYHRERAGLRRK